MTWVGRACRNSKAEAGFSLLEVVVAVAVIAILTGVATLSISDFLPSLRLKRASQELQLQIQKARLEAVRLNRFCYVEFHKVIGGNRYAPLIWVDENSNGTYESGEEFFRQEVDGGTLELDDFGGIRFDSAQGGGDGVAFDPGATSAANAFRFNLRGLSDKAGTVHLLNSAGRRKIIEITLGGAIRIR